MDLAYALARARGLLFRNGWCYSVFQCQRCFLFGLPMKINHQQEGFLLLMATAGQVQKWSRKPKLAPKTKPRSVSGRPCVVSASGAHCTSMFQRMR